MRKDGAKLISVWQESVLTLRSEQCQQKLFLEQSGNRYIGAS